MASRQTSTRREFLIGQSAADALTGLLDESLAQEGQAAARPEQSTPSYRVEVGRRAMACRFEVLFNAGQYPHATSTAVTALDTVDAIESQLTVYRDDSDLMHINRTAGREAVELETGLLGLLQFAVRLHADTAGAYDITSGPLSKVWGFYRRQGRLPGVEELAAALERVGSQWLKIDAAGRTIRFLREGVELNLGSIGKGYALDRAAESLQSAGIDDFLFHGGQSSVLAHGGQEPDAPQAGWWVGVGHPLRPGKRLAKIRLCNRGLGTTGAGTQFFRHQGRRYGHILDPRTGWPAEGVLSVTVTALTAAEADALSTAFFVLGPDPAVQYCDVHPGIAALFVCPGSKGEVRVTTVGLDDKDLSLVGGD